MAKCGEQKRSKKSRGFALEIFLVRRDDTFLWDLPSPNLTRNLKRMVSKTNPLFQGGIFKLWEGKTCKFFLVVFFIWVGDWKAARVGWENLIWLEVVGKNLRLEVWVSCWTFGLTMSSWRQKNCLCLRDDPCNGFPILPWGKIWSWDFLQIYLPFMEGYVLYFMRARGNCCFFFHPLAALEDQATPENVMQDLPPQNMEKRLRVSVF